MVTTELAIRPNLQMVPLRRFAASRLRGFAAHVFIAYQSLSAAIVHGVTITWPDALVTPVSEITTRDAITPVSEITTRDVSYDTKTRVTKTSENK